MADPGDDLHEFLVDMGGVQVAGAGAGRQTDVDRPLAERMRAGADRDTGHDGVAERAVIALQELHADAARYRWIRQMWTVRPGTLLVWVDNLILNCGLSFDEAVDRLRGAEDVQ